MSIIQNQIIDVVIPAHHKDLITLNHSIRSIKKHIKNVRKIIVVSKERYTNEADWFDESLYPFSFDEISQLTGKARIGWYFQQFLKLYAPLVIPNISENVLIIDADTVFFRDIAIFSEDGKPLYNLSKDKDILTNPFYQQSEAHITRLIPDLNRNNIPQEFHKISGISHHMLFQKKVIEDIFAKTAKIHQTQEPFYKTFLKLAERGESVAEYGLYYWFILVYYFDQVKFRRLKYKNTAKVTFWRYKLAKKYHYCSYHSYMRNDDQSSRCSDLWQRMKFFYKKLVS